MHALPLLACEFIPGDSKTRAEKERYEEGGCILMCGGKREEGTFSPRGVVNLRAADPEPEPANACPPCEAMFCDDP